ncbi:MAG: hypothetical protein KDE00_13160 [Rhodobacteraceae bacterium]|nr:hypothetical protein [Paracoccaceae bacterium]
MPEPKLMAIVTALMLMAGTVPARAAYNIEQLQQIEQYIVGKDCGGLWTYLNANPTIMAGDDALARELKIFVSATERGQVACFGVRPIPAVVPPTPVVAFAATTPQRIEPY